MHAPSLAVPDLECSRRPCRLASRGVSLMLSRSTVYLEAVTARRDWAYFYTGVRRGFQLLMRATSRWSDYA